MTTVFATPPVLGALPDRVRGQLDDQGLRRRAGALSVAIVLHAAALWALVALPPAVMPQVERAASAISVRLYTVAGGADAETDAPLFEPPLAGGQVAEAGGRAGRAQAGSEDGARDGQRATPAPEVDPEAAAAPEPIEAPAPEPAMENEPETAAEPAAEPAPDAATASPPQSAAQPATGALEVEAGASNAAAPPAEPVRPGQPVATSQPPGEAAPAPARGSGPPSFADILARAERRLDPEDFQILVNFGNGVRETVRENFCLSSVEANREAFDCPEGVNRDSARLAQYGLQGLGEEPPEFLEDMDRLAFQLATMGADDGAIQRILLSLRESRREVIEAGPLRRQMDRDARPENNNDVPGAP